MNAARLLPDRAEQAQDTTLHQVGIFGEIESVSPPVLGDKLSTELRRFTPRASIGHQMLLPA